MATKYCSRCNRTLDVSAFSKDRSIKDGLSARCRECRSKHNKHWYHQTLSAEERKARHLRRKAERAAWQREYYKKHRDVFRAKSRKWAQDNRDAHRDNTRRNMRKRRATAKGRLESNLCSAVYKALKAKKAGRGTFALLGFTIEELMTHLERQFIKGMCWENYGEWHVDHIVPLTNFRYSEATDAEFKRAWALTNLRPLWAKENISKGGRVSLLL